MREREGGGRVFVYEILFKAGRLMVHLYSFRQQVLVDVHEVSGTLLCGQDMVLNIIDPTGG